MGACVSKFNSLGGAQTNTPEETREETVKGEVTAADEETERRSLGYLFRENKGEAPAESSSSEAAVKLEEKEPLSVPSDSYGKDEKEKPPVANVSESKSSEEKNTEDAKNVEAEASLKKTEEEVPEVQIHAAVENSEDKGIVKSDEKHELVENSGNDRGKSEEHEPVLPVEKDAIEVKPAEIEITNKGEDTKPDDESSTVVEPETRVMENEDQKPELDEAKKELQPFDTTTNLVASENEPQTSETKNSEQDFAETSAPEKAETKEQEEKIITPPLDAEKPKTGQVEDTNMEASLKVPIDELPATEKSVENIEKEHTNDKETSQTTNEHLIAALVSEKSK